MKKELINSDLLQELSIAELQSIDGGDWLRNLGAAAHRAWCKLVDEFNNPRQPSGMGAMYSAHN